MRSKTSIGAKQSERWREAKRASARSKTSIGAKQIGITSMAQLVVSGSFDNLGPVEIRYLQDLANRGQVHVLLWSDELVRSIDGKSPKFAQIDRQYFLRAIRFVDQVDIVAKQDGTDAPPFNSGPKVAPVEGRKKVVVTGRFNRLNVDNVLFFEQANELGDVYVVVGNDAIADRRDGALHPPVSQDERRFAVGSICFVKQALIASGDSKFESEPEFERIKPGLCLANKESENPETRAYCEKQNIEYRALKHH